MLSQIRGGVWGGWGQVEKSKEKESFLKISASAKVFIKILDKWSLCPSPLLPGAPCYFYANNNLVVYILLFPLELQRHDLRRVRGGGGSWWGWRERKRERGKRDRELEWVFTQVWKNIVRSERQEQKKIAGITCLFQSPHLQSSPHPICKPAPFKIHWASGDHAQSICFHFIICISCLLAFDVLILWCSQETRIIIISIFKGVNGIGTCTHRFFSLQPLRTPSLLILHPNV